MIEVRTGDNYDFPAEVWYLIHGPFGLWRAGLSHSSYEAAHGVVRTKGMSDADGRESVLYHGMHENRINS